MGKRRMSKGVRAAERNGYTVVDCKLEHRSVYRKTQGKIPAGWVIHHVNEDRKDNRIENLVAMPRRMHTRLHEYQRINGYPFSKEQIERVTAALKIRTAALDREIHRLQQERDNLDLTEFENIGLPVGHYVVAPPPLPPPPKKLVWKRRKKIVPP